MKKYLPWIIVVLSLVGLVDSALLVYEHFVPRFVPCSTTAYVDCGKVLTSRYATVFGVPLAVIGVLHYVFLGIVAVLAIVKKSKWWSLLVTITAIWGFVASCVFIYIQVIILRAICLYCMVSAINSIVLLALVKYAYGQTVREPVLEIIGVLYRKMLKPFFFRFDAEFIHNMMTDRGELIGSIAPLRAIFTYIFVQKFPVLEQTVAGISFRNPIGLSAGFDYEAKLTQVLPAVGFGFQTVGTVTNLPYEGNATPRLGRLVESKSLLVNKGFRNAGMYNILKKISGKQFAIPVGISIGRTNTTIFSKIEQAIEDVVIAFTKAENSKVKHSYYELNISCPNLHGEVDFYKPKNLQMLLQAVTALNLTRPVFIKMPIEKGNKEVLAMMEVITEFPVAGVIFGNLQKDRTDTSFVKKEISAWEGKKGNFSGKPTWKRSNELIKLVYQRYGKSIVIIGSGGVFSAEDAYTKIRLGASLVQLITGMIFQGPQVITEINIGLERLLKRDGFTSITEAIGVDVQKTEK